MKNKKRKNPVNVNVAIININMDKPKKYIWLRRVLKLGGYVVPLLIKSLWPYLESIF
ncbi:hypothetical protein [Paenibacillus alvei]|uniref:hypothetical protein n=1 Tax=Paenibacillus alvei TaxID=44250 RepID=UPI00227EBEDD|nr:hypothetical protein [Paenibacillus alvei]